MEITFLGTSAMVPTADRSHYSIFLSYDTEGILFDCGEGTQRQLKIAKIPFSKVTRILISHFHGDHTLGLAGLVESMCASLNNKTLKIYGPKGIKKFTKTLFELFPFESNIEIIVEEIKKGRFLETDKFCVYAYELEHGLCYGFKFIEKDKRRINMKRINELGIPEGPLLGKLQAGKSIKHNGKTISPDETTFLIEGKKIGIISDTNYTKNCVEIGKNTDLLISEATFSKKDEDKARMYNHLTAEQAAKIAHSSNAKKLVLTHLSQRYKEISEIENEAKDIFPNTVCAYDLMKVKL